MNNQQFILWLGGFVDAVGEKGPTPKQWETIVSELNQVKEPVSYPIYTPNTGPVPLPNVTFPYGAPIPVTCGTDTILTATSGSAIYNPSTTTTTLPKGVNVSYTANLPEQEDKLKANGYVD